MELNLTISELVLLPVALALIAGGLVLYRRSTRVGWQATGMGSVALGAGVLLVFIVTLPVFLSSEGGAPEPVIQDSVASTSLVNPGGAPRARLTYEGAVYYQEALSNAEAANLNEDGLELVGSTTDSNTLPPNGGESLKIYRLNNGEAYQVYTLIPGRSFQDEEDGSTITIEPEWTRWSAG